MAQAQIAAEAAVPGPKAPATGREERIGEHRLEVEPAPGTEVPAPVPSVETPKRLDASELLARIGAYIPTEVTTAYVPVAAGIVIAEGSKTTKIAVAVAFALFAVMITWSAAHSRAAKRARDAAKPPPSAGETFAAGWYEVLVAGFAFFAWAIAIPGSFVDFGDSAFYLPVVIVFGAAVIFGFLAIVLNRPAPEPA